MEGLGLITFQSQIAPPRLHQLGMPVQIRQTAAAIQGGFLRLRPRQPQQPETFSSYFSPEDGAMTVDVQEVNAKVDSHIDVCAVRYEAMSAQFDIQITGVNARLKKIERSIVWAVITILGSLGTIITLLINYIMR
jgi:hypothetical protein